MQYLNYQIITMNIYEQKKINFFTELHPDATNLFGKDLWDATRGQYSIIHPKGGKPIFCKLHKELSINDNQKHHNCLACNLSESIKYLGKFLNNGVIEEDFEYSYSMFILLLHLQTEKFFTLFTFLGITRKYQSKNWEVLSRINRWANFIKHPKGFLFSHHPKMLISKTQILENERAGIKELNYKNFISKYYTNENADNFYNSINLIKGKKNIVLIVDSPIYLMGDFAKFCEEIIKIIAENSFFRNQLIENTTIEDYWSIEG